MSSAVFIGRAHLKHNNTGCFLLGILVMWSSVQANELDMQLQQASGKVDVIAATTGELQQFKDRVKSAFNGAKSDDWQNLNLQQVNHQDFITLAELPTAKQGRGFFAINTGSTKNRLLQAPHADSDLYTGKIAGRLFEEGEFKAAQWNTVKRDISDLAHTPNTYWQAFTLAFAEQYPDGKIIQIHGYAQDLRKTEAGESSDMILSAGHDAAPLWVQQTAACLKNAFPKRVSLYPLDVQELGGTTNIQGQLLTSLKHDGFLHIEMSKDMRQELLDKPESRKLLLNCL